MIHMPKRSVTRFFIPLIDVMLLLFCVFLLMPIASEKKNEGEVKNAKKTIDILERELDSLRHQLKRLEKLKSGAAYHDLEERELKLQEQLKKQTKVYVLDIDPENGELYYFDRAANPQKQYLKTEQQAKDFLEKRAKAAPESHRYYQIEMPRQPTDYPSLGQLREYQRWLQGVDNSIKGVRY